MIMTTRDGKHYTECDNHKCGATTTGILPSHWGRLHSTQLNRTYDFCQECVKVMVGKYGFMEDIPMGDEMEDYEDR